ncbi:MAG TPA: sensor domain-containing diguanylate cyclase [Thermoanaerobaculia bacterium]|jgi:diguanylate cyclase (GGDEF)-like protein
MVIGVLIALLLAAGMAAVVLRRARAEAAGLRLLIEMSGLLQVSTTFDDAIEIVPVFGRHLFPALDGALYVAKGSRFELAATWGETRSHASTHGPQCQAARYASVQLVDAAELDVRCAVADGATLCLPLLGGGVSIGVLTLRARDGESLRSRTNLFAHAFADHVSLALANLRLQEKLLALAERDSLTGAFNRRYMEETLERELTSNARTGAILIDVDHFKTFNDTHGHAGGDALLQLIAKVMKQVLGDDGIVCRYGGDEFVVVLPDTAPELVRDAAERLRVATRELRVDDLGGATISIGFACTPEHATSAQGLMAAADRALYNAKATGRDRVASPPPHAVDRNAA